MKEVCVTCRWLSVEVDLPNKTEATCRRFAPIRSGAKYAWPQVDAHQDWCGEWQKVITQQGGQ
jgi:hypothetical protein